MEDDENEYESKNLKFCVFRCPEDEEFFHELQSDLLEVPEFIAKLPRPMSTKRSTALREDLINNTLLFMVIYSKEGGEYHGNIDGMPITTDEKLFKKPKLIYSALPIEDEERAGTLFLKPSGEDRGHRRCAELGIHISNRMRIEGLEEETARWALNWAFLNAGQHRVELNIPGWDSYDLEKYERVGFREERKRECLYKDGKWWDEVWMGILKKEWKEIKSREEVSSQDVKSEEQDDPMY
ncbi:Acyl-CoA N-acyltransferase [Penicillium angulare]|uniref:Acyl-CoA N-acyltransferase n=1 Tax=Penicillium angulare TaxID=116970 RepID=A0A9W9G726_9EURO|nr:Acyl-CoA N-acyltransferase [Penicillium angulare]